MDRFSFLFPLTPTPLPPIDPKTRDVASAMLDRGWVKYDEYPLEIRGPISPEVQAVYDRRTQDERDRGDPPFPHDQDKAEQFYWAYSNDYSKRMYESERGRFMNMFSRGIRPIVESINTFTRPQDLARFFDIGRSDTLGALPREIKAQIQQWVLDSTKGTPSKFPNARFGIPDPENGRKYVHMYSNPTWDQMYMAHKDRFVTPNSTAAASGLKRKLEEISDGS